MHTQISSRTSPLGIEINAVALVTSTRTLADGMSRVSLTCLVCSLARSSEYWEMLWRWGLHGLRVIFAAFYIKQYLASHSNIHTRTRKSHLAHLHSALNQTQLRKSLQPGYWELECLECHYYGIYVQVSIERCFGDEVFMVCVLSLLLSILSNISLLILIFTHAHANLILHISTRHWIKRSYARVFNQDIGSWNVSSVTTMAYMFKWVLRDASEMRFLWFACCFCCILF